MPDYYSKTEVNKSEILTNIWEISLRLALTRHNARTVGLDATTYHAQGV
jgi:hypothetical protein